MIVSGLFYYPIKSCGGVSTPSLTFDHLGPVHDREWMVVDASTGLFVTQRTHPQLQLVKPRVEGGRLLLKGLVETAGPARSVEVWGDHLDAEDQGEDFARYFSQICQKPVRLVRFGKARRITGKPGRERELRFSDSFPVHICTEESLAAFNAEAGTLLEMDRFRANIVLRGLNAPWDEDGWTGIEIGGVRFPRKEPATRCAITTVDPVTARKGPEPLKTLARIRRGPKGVEFGQYFASVPGARIELGMEAEPY